MIESEGSREGRKFEQAFLLLLHNFTKIIIHLEETPKALDHFAATNKYNKKGQDVSPSLFVVGKVTKPICIMFHVMGI